MAEPFVVGVNHRYAPIELREKLAFSRLDLPRALDGLRAFDFLEETVVLSTCNRVEVYGVAEHPRTARAEVLRFLGDFHGVDTAELRRASYFYLSREAVRHLFRVTAGLDSMVVGENEILGQVKEAFGAASKAGRVRSVLHPLFERAFRTAKRTKQETKISEGAVSVSSVAVELAQKIFGNLSRQNILILGTGKVSVLTLKRLLKDGARQVWVASRTAARAEELAEDFGVRAIAFEDWRRFLKDSDIVISSTAAPHPVIHYEDVKQAMAARRHKPLFIIDIAVPRDTAPEVNTLDDVYLYNIDDLKGISGANLKFRQKEITKCEAIVEQQADDFMFWLKQMKSAPTIQKLHAYFDRLIEEELRLLDRSEPPEKLEAVRSLLVRIKGKFLHQPIAKLKATQHNGGGHHYHEVLHTLFGLENMKPDDSENEGENRNPGKRTGSCANPQSSE
jgi:glutamyl-tRNA reductase